MSSQGATIQIRRCGARAAGLTALELLAVVVVLAVLTVLVVPTLTNVGGSARTSAVSRIVRDLQFARQRAISLGRCTWVVFDTDQEQYAIVVESTGSPGRAGRVPLIDEATGRAFVVVMNRGEWRGATIEAVDIAGGSEVGFDARGRPLGPDDSILTQDGVIRLAGDHTIRVAARTGLIQRAQ